MPEKGVTMELANKAPKEKGISLVRRISMPVFQYAIYGVRQCSQSPEGHVAHPAMSARIS
ncbi:MAG: hypothetical protein U9N58_07450 [Thermodesulfobacteriota bacterium]|nr:hypothetical protein [Thermodesulfobacteriota bacterium]